MWDEIPIEHRHYNGPNLCTHHPSKLKYYVQKDRSVEILTSAWKLYKAYLTYKKTGAWRLPDLPHNYGASKGL